MEKRNWYKSYIHSKGATLCSLISTLACDAGIAFLVTAIGELVRSENKRAESILIYAIILFFSAFIGKMLEKSIERRVSEKLLELSYMDAEELVNRKPSLKKWFMNNHNGYRQFHESECFFEHNSLESDKINKKDILSNCYIIVVLVIGLVGSISFIESPISNDVVDTSLNVFDDKQNENENRSSMSSDIIDETKYKAYITLNNDIIQCYNYSIDLYIKDKGIEENIEDNFYPEKVEIIPITKYVYEDLEYVKSILSNKPKMDIDEYVEKLIEPLEEVYILTNQIYYAYGKEENEIVPRVETSMTKEELHKEYLNAIGELGYYCDEFFREIDELEEIHVQKELEQYKTSGDMDSYENLKILVESEKIYNYFVDNNITNENLFNINLDEYNDLLKEYNNAYSEFENHQSHTGGYSDDVKEFNVLANNVVLMVNERNFEAGEDDNHGVKVSGGIDDIQYRFYELLDDIISSYNDIYRLRNS